MPPACDGLSNSSTRRISATSGGEAARIEDCVPGIAVEVLIPTAELEARNEYGTRLHIESCVAETCACAALEFDLLACDDRLLFALEGTPKTGAFFAWSAGMSRLRLRVVRFGSSSKCPIAIVTLPPP